MANTLYLKSDKANNQIDVDNKYFIDKDVVNFCKIYS